MKNLIISTTLMLASFSAFSDHAIDWETKEHSGYVKTAEGKFISWNEKEIVVASNYKNADHTWAWDSTAGGGVIEEKIKR